MGAQAPRFSRPHTQPVRAGRGTVDMAATVRIELEKVGEQPMYRCIEVRCLLGWPRGKRIRVPDHRSV